MSDARSPRQRHRCCPCTVLAGDTSSRPPGCSPGRQRQLVLSSRRAQGAALAAGSGLAGLLSWAARALRVPPSACKRACRPCHPRGLAPASVFRLPWARPGAFPRRRRWGSAAGTASGGRTRRDGASWQVAWLQDVSPRLWPRLRAMLSRSFLGSVRFRCGSDCSHPHLWLGVSVTSEDPGATGFSARCQGSEVRSIWLDGTQQGASRVKEVPCIATPCGASTQARPCGLCGPTCRARRLPGWPEEGVSRPQDQPTLGDPRWMRAQPYRPSEPPSSHLFASFSSVAKSTRGNHRSCCPERGDP